MKWDARSSLLSGALVVMVVLGLIWVARGLRREEPKMIVNPEAPSVAMTFHPELEAGIEALRAERFDEARVLLERVPVTHPSYTVALQNLGELHERTGNLEAAVESYDTIITVQPSNAEPYLRLAWLEHRRGRAARAEWYAMRALEIAPGHIPARYGVALFRLGDGRVADAVVAYSRAMSYDPQETYLAEAGRQVRELAAERPDSADVHYALAFFANTRGDRPEEIRELEAYLAKAPQGEAADTARERLAEAIAAVESQDPKEDTDGS